MDQIPSVPSARTPPAAENAGRLLLTIPQAEQATGLSRATLYRVLGTGALESVKIGRCRRIRLDALRAWIESLPEAGE